MHLQPRTLGLFATVSLLVGAAVAAADSWPQWRGVGNQGISLEKNLPIEWGPKLNVAWSIPLPGPAGSTPIVFNDSMFLTSAEGKDIVLLSIRSDGMINWKRQIGTGNKAFRGDEGNEASPSPITDGKYVWAFAGTGDFACYDYEGGQIWRFNAQDRYGRFKIMHGIHVTPMLDGPVIYHALLHQGGMWVYALDKMTGKELWKVERKTDGRGEGEHSYASPAIWRDGNLAYLIVHGCDYTTAHDLASGDELWRLGELNPKDRYNPTLRFVSSPAASPGVIVVPTAKKGPVIGVDPKARGILGEKGKGELWRLPRGTPDVPSPLIFDNIVYLLREDGGLSAHEALTGKELYFHKLHNSRYRSSPVYADGRLYCMARDGTCSVVQAGPVFKLVSLNKLPDSFTASPAIANGRIYLRGYETLWAVGPAQ